LHPNNILLLLLNRLLLPIVEKLADITLKFTFRSIISLIRLAKRANPKLLKKHPKIFNPFHDWLILWNQFSIDHPKIQSKLVGEVLMPYSALMGFIIETTFPEQTSAWMWPVVVGFWLSYCLTILTIQAYTDELYREFHKDKSLLADYEQYIYYLTVHRNQSLELLRYKRRSIFTEAGLPGPEGGPNFKPTVKNIAGFAVIGGLYILGKYVSSEIRKSEFSHMENEKRITDDRTTANTLAVLSKQMALEEIKSRSSSK
jgi:hypothetical protein